MNLPGGVLLNGELWRTFAFKPVSGDVELAVAEAASGSATVPSRVTAVLTAALEHVGGEAPTWRRLHGLSVGDRQFLVRHLSAHLGVDGIWLSARCAACEGMFDFFIQQSALPAKPAGEGYPFAEVDTSVGKCCLRVPTGADQEAVAEITDEEDSIRVLVRRLVMKPEPDAGDFDAFTEEDLHVIEAALEAVAPEVATEAQVVCPECGQVNRISVDPCVCLDIGGKTLFSEIHLLASTYHWGESEILALPRARRHKYLQLVDRASGMTE